jgi:hypothetical protein
MARVPIHPEDVAVIPESLGLGPGVRIGHGVIPEGSDSRYPETNESLDGGPTLMQMRGELELYCAGVDRQNHCPVCPGKYGGCPGYRGGITPNARLPDAGKIFWNLTTHMALGDMY